jgi:hypothetical protein
MKYRKLGEFDRPASIVLVTATLLNAALAFSNSLLFPINSTIASLAQLAITAAALGIAVLRRPQLPLSFWIACACLAVFALMASMWNELNSKHYYDLMVIPIFIIFGSVIRQFPFKAFKLIFIAVGATCFLDAFAVGLYTTLFNPLSFFRNTRVWVSDQLASGSDEMGLYLGANRGGGSFFGFLTDHRLGGPFLEPLSLGYFAVVACMFFAVWFRHYPWQRAAAFAACLVLALLADSRVPSAVIILFFGLSFLQAYIRMSWSAVAPVIVLLAAFFFYLLSDGRLAESETPRRIAITFDVVAETNIFEFFTGALSVTRFGDSGILYLVYAATLPGMMLCLYLFSGALSSTRLTPPILPLMASIYITTTALFGGAFLSIKTSALLGILLGAASVGAVRSKSKARSMRKQPAPFSQPGYKPDLGAVGQQATN